MWQIILRCIVVFQIHVCIATGEKVIVSLMTNKSQYDLAVSFCLLNHFLRNYLKLGCCKLGQSAKVTEGFGLIVDRADNLCISCAHNCSSYVVNATIIQRS